MRRGGHEYKLFPSPTRSPPTPRLGAHFPLDVRPLASARVRFCPPAFVGFGFRRLHPVLIHSASSFLTKSTTQRTASRTFMTYFDYFLRLLHRQDALWLSPHHILTFFFLTDYATSCQMAALMTTTTTWTTTRPIFIDSNFNLRELVPKSRGFHFARGPGIRSRGHQPPEPASCSTRCPPPRRVRAPETGRAKRPTYSPGGSK